MSKATRVIAGAMSGTSGDGVDVALVEISGRGLVMSAKLLKHHHVPFDAELKKTIFAARDSGTIPLGDLAKMGRQISLAYARGVGESLASARLGAGDLAAVAAHGQTLFHNPPDTIQWLDPALIAAEVGCPVVSDFRRADCAASGQGAPLVPFADYILFRHAEENRVLLNIGGIANLTLLPAGCRLEDLIAFDTGPGNCICDALCRRFAPAGPGFDQGGAIASRGRISAELQSVLKKHAYFQKPPPKSTDGPAMVRLFDDAVRRLDVELSEQDLMATAVWLTAWSISRSVPTAWQVIASGGGVQNPQLIKSLADAGCKVRTTDEFGVPSVAKEAMAFALLGAATLDGVSSNVPSVTGAKRAVVLGSITPKP